MQKKSLIKLEKKTNTISKQLIGELYLLRDMNDIIAFTQTYISNYLPVLFYAVKHFDKNKIAKLMNSSILIDRLLFVKINDVVRFQVSTGVKDFLNVNPIEDKDTVARLFNNLTSVNKANLSSSLLFMFSLMRGALFALYCDNKLYLNYGIGWNSLLYHFVESPHLIFTLDNKDLKLAEEQLDYIENDLKKLDGKLQNEVASVLIEGDICSTEEIKTVDIHFVGMKYEWLRSKSLVAYCKYLKTDDKKQLEESIKYSKIILESLENSETSYHSFSFRDKLSFPGPSPYIKDILGDLKQYKKIIKIFNYGAYFESDESRFVVIFPTSLEFYFNYNLVNKDKIPILDDEEFILDMHRKECFGLLDYLDIITKPNESAFYYSMKKYSETLQEFNEKGLSNKFIYNQLKNSEIADKIISAFEKKVNKSKVVSNVFGIGIISTFNYFAEARSLPQIPAYVNTTLPLVTEIVMNAIYKSGYDKLIVELSVEKSEETDFLGLDEDDEYNSIVKLEKQISFLEESTNDLFNYVNLNGLKEIFHINTKITSLIKSNKSVEEINEELEKLYIDTKD